MSTRRIVLTCVVLLTSCAVPRLLGATVEQALSYGGGILQLVGLISVVNALLGRHRFATGRGVWATFVLRFRRLFGRKPPSQVIRPEPIESSVKVFSPTLVRSATTVEDRLAELERGQRNLYTELATARRDAEQADSAQRDAIASEQRTRRRAHEELRDELRQQAGEGIHIDLMGFVWVGVGIALQTWADWFAPFLTPIFTRWGL